MTNNSECREIGPELTPVPVLNSSTMSELSAYRKAWLANDTRPTEVKLQTTIHNLRQFRDALASCEIPAGSIYTDTAIKQEHTKYETAVGGVQSDSQGYPIEVRTYAEKTEACDLLMKLTTVVKPQLSDFWVLTKHHAECIEDTSLEVPCLPRDIGTVYRGFNYEQYLNSVVPAICSWNSGDSYCLQPEQATDNLRQFEDVFTSIYDENVDKAEGNLYWVEMIDNLLEPLEDNLIAFREDHCCAGVQEAYEMGQYTLSLPTIEWIQEDSGDTTSELNSDIATYTTAQWEALMPDLATEALELLDGESYETYPKDTGYKSGKYSTLLKG